MKNVIIEVLVLLLIFFYMVSRHSMERIHMKSLKKLKQGNLHSFRISETMCPSLPNIL